jgi:hypothetical protein
LRVMYCGALIIPDVIVSPAGKATKTSSLLYCRADLGDPSSDGKRSIHSFLGRHPDTC